MTQDMEVLTVHKLDKAIICRGKRIQVDIEVYGHQKKDLSGFSLSMLKAKNKKEE